MKRTAFGALLIATLLVSEYAFGSTALGLSVALAAVLLLGLPHGASDMVLFRALFPQAGKLPMLAAIFAYLIIASVVVIGWLWHPTLFLVAFLLYSAYHFADDWSRSESQLMALSGGVLTLALPIVAKPEQTSAIFAALKAQPEVAVTLFSWLAPLALIVFAAMLWRCPRMTRGRLLAQLIGFTALAALLPPISYFAVYFCVIHAINHEKKVQRHVDNSALSVHRRLNTVISLAVLALVFAWLVQSGLPAVTASLQVVFIGLAALTVPHMLLVAWWQRASL